MKHIQKENSTLSYNFKIFINIMRLVDYTGMKNFISRHSKKYKRSKSSQTHQKAKALNWQLQMSCKTSHIINIKVCPENQKNLNIPQTIEIQVWTHYAYRKSKGMRLRHPRKDRSSTSSLAWQRRKLLGSHCECCEKQAFEFVIISISS